eukprot:1869440-Prymnesium_polylepis.1
MSSIVAEAASVALATRAGEAEEATRKMATASRFASVASRTLTYACRPSGEKSTCHPHPHRSHALAVRRARPHTAKARASVGVSCRTQLTSAG